MARETHTEAMLAQLHEATKATRIHLEGTSEAVASHLAAQEEPGETQEES